jgi:quercetin dioxygenase-like cupin family protein
MDLDSALPAPIQALPTTGNHIPAHQLVAEGCEVLFVHATAGTELPRHDHPTENVTAIVSGAMVLITDEGEHPCAAGDWYQTRPGEMHAVRFDADTVQIEFRFAAGAIPQPTSRGPHEQATG